MFQSCLKLGLALYGNTVDAFKARCCIALRHAGLHPIRLAAVPRYRRIAGRA
jgi:hypothetical protein